MLDHCVTSRILQATLEIKALSELTLWVAGNIWRKLYLFMPSVLCPWHTCRKLALESSAANSRWIPARVATKFALVSNFGIRPQHYNLN